MIQKCSLIRVAEVFFKEPTQIHFVREISRKIKLATTSVNNYVLDLKKEELILGKKSKPFDGLIANRDNEKFLYYKRAYNLYSLFELRRKIIGEIAPKAIVLFGSYQRGEDIETSDIDLLVMTKIVKKINLEKYEKELNRKVHLTFSENLDKLDKNIKENIKNGVILYGGL